MRRLLVLVFFFALAAPAAARDYVGPRRPVDRVRPRPVLLLPVREQPVRLRQAAPGHEHRLGLELRLQAERERGPGLQPPARLAARRRAGDAGHRRGRPGQGLGVARRPRRRDRAARLSPAAPRPLRHRRRADRHRPRRDASLFTRGRGDREPRRRDGRGRDAGPSRRARGQCARGVGRPERRAHRQLLLRRQPRRAQPGLLPDRVRRAREGRRAVQGRREGPAGRRERADEGRAVADRDRRRGAQPAGGAAGLELREGQARLAEALERLARADRRPRRHARRSRSSSTPTSSTSCAGAAW